VTYQSPSSYWGIPEEEASRLPLGLRHSNNLFNIKYFRGAEKYPQRWPGLMGPSIARDQGDPQMKFATVEDSGVAGAELLRRKYQSGMRTPRQIIAGNQGWTPGYTGAAENVARVAGVGVDDDLRLDTPEGLRRFLPALAEQEHGADTAKRLFKPTLYDNIMMRLGGPAPSPNQGLDGAPAATPAAFAQRRRPMPAAPEEEGFFSKIGGWLNTPIGQARAATQPIRDRYADPNGSLDFTTEEFLKKYPALDKPGVREQIPAMLDVYKMGRNLNRAALNEEYTPKPATWGQAFGEGLKGLGAVLTARAYPQMGMQMAQGVGADWRERNGMREKLSLQSALQQAQSLTTASDAAIKGAMERLEAKRKLNALSRMADANEPAPYPEAEEGAVSGATALPSGTKGVGGVSAAPIPVERGTLPDVGAQPQATPQTTQTQAQPVVGGGAAPSGRQPVVAPQGEMDPSQRKAKVFAMDPSTKGLSDFYQKEYELRSAPEREAATTTAREAAKTQAEIAERNMKLGETAKKMTGLFNKLEEHATEPGMGHVIGPFDNNPWLGHWAQQMNPWAAYLL
jgi:hypothetical protein